MIDPGAGRDGPSGGKRRARGPSCSAGLTERKSNSNGVASHAGLYVPSEIPPQAGQPYVPSRTIGSPKQANRSAGSMPETLSRSTVVGQRGPIGARYSRDPSFDATQPESSKSSPGVIGDVGSGTSCPSADTVGRTTGYHVYPSACTGPQPTE